MKKIRFLLIAAAAAGLSGCGTSPEAVVERFHQSVAKGEIEEAKKYLHPDLVGMLGERKVTTVLSAQAEQLQKCGGIEKLTTELTGEGEIRNGTVTIDLKGDCPTKTQKISLNKLDGKWLISVDK